MISMSVNTSAVEDLLKDNADLGNQLAIKAYEFFKQTTPYHKGNARSQTKLGSDNSIQANYPYAAVLDAGRGVRDGQMRGSTQAPQGMTAPTIEYMNQIMDSLIKKD